MQLTNKSGNKHTVYPCRKEGCSRFTFHKGSLCVECYKLKRKENASRPPVVKIKFKIDKHKKYPCKNCGTLIRKFNGLCHTCYNKALHIQGEIKQIENNKRKSDTEKRMAKQYKPAKRQICPDSPEPNKNHVEIIDTSTNIGKCKYCGRTKDYNKIQDNEFKAKLFGGNRK